MRILISSHRFAPDVGGIETVSGLLAAEWRRAGHVVDVVTMSAASADAAPEPHVHRRPSAARLLALVRACDVYWHSNISLQTAWPLLFVRRPWFVTAHTWLRGVDGRLGWRGRLKRRVLARAINLYPSAALAAHVAQRGRRVRNPYANDVFRLAPELTRDRELIFAGRLVSDKGVDVLLGALSRLAPARRPRLTIVGGGPDEEKLRADAARLGVASQIDWAGLQPRDALARLFNRHRVLVVPSRWEEPFGLVAVEGIACGCRVIASDSGGLREAVGAVGELFPNGNEEALAAAMARALDAPPLDAASPAVREHLAPFTAPRVAADYLRIFDAVLEEPGA